MLENISAFSLRLLGALLLGFLPCQVWADVELWGGKPSLGLEFEHQKMAFGAGHANSLTLVPGLRFKNAFINKVDILIEGERENEVVDGVNEKARVKKLALRLKKTSSSTTLGNCLCAAWWVASSAVKRTSPTAI